MFCLHVCMQARRGTPGLIIDDCKPLSHLSNPKFLISKKHKDSTSVDVMNSDFQSVNNIEELKSQKNQRRKNSPLLPGSAATIMPTHSLVVSL